MIGSGRRFERGDIVDESGGSGKPRSGTDAATERHEGPQTPAAPAADTTRPGPDRHEHPTGPTPSEPSEPHTEAPQDEPRAPAGPDSSDKPRAHADTSDSADSSDEPRTHPDSADEPRVHAGPSGDHAPDPDPGRRPRAAGEPAGRDEHAPGRTLARSGTGKGRPPRRPKDPGGGLLMGRPFGVPVYVAPSWFLVAALITWVFGGQLDRVLPELGAARYLVSLFFAVAFYASVLVHELAHTVAALRFKLPVRRIQLQFFGGVSEIEKEAETPGREFVLAFVGPLLSLVLSGLFYLAMLPVEPGTVPGVLLAGLMVSNLIVAVFNLLPGLPLDGGRMLRAVVWKITGRPMSISVIAVPRVLLCLPRVVIRSPSATGTGL